MHGLRYVAIVDGGGDVWGARIPDIQGCCGGGSTPEAAINDVTGALSWVAADMLKDGETIPTPTDLGEIMARMADGREDAGATVFVPLLLDSGRSVKANISLDTGLLEQIDAEAKRRGLTRSAFLASAARDKISEAR